MIICSLSKWLYLTPNLADVCVSIVLDISIATDRLLLVAIFEMFFSVIQHLGFLTTDFLELAFDQEIEVYDNINLKWKMKVFMKSDVIDFCNIFWNLMVKYCSFWN